MLARSFPSFAFFVSKFSRYSHCSRKISRKILKSSYYPEKFVSLISNHYLFSKTRTVLRKQKSKSKFWQIARDKVYLKFKWALYPVSYLEWRNSMSYDERFSNKPFRNNKSRFTREISERFPFDRINGAILLYFYARTPTVLFQKITPLMQRSRPFCHVNTWAFTTCVHVCIYVRTCTY